MFGAAPVFFAQNSVYIGFCHNNSGLQIIRRHCTDIVTCRCIQHLSLCLSPFTEMIYSNDSFLKG